ncbi:hypothetical protein HYPDE_22923 [Hyphomicrobium denitrificans 1NES1]|uniref:Uncharacterized protein n=1 Tax=Hyphomicrobium denitrificans 1NES1 TaxID=670307 RepID=N0B6V1_9HYPH|nr:hypothetical protein HYPDE_22923 [Hyphomicrobium denitrificans 1NES1]
MRCSQFGGAFFDCGGTTSPRASSADVAADIAEPTIRNIVHSFYEKARRDDMLGSIFGARVQNCGA